MPLLNKALPALWQGFSRLPGTILCLPVIVVFASVVDPQWALWEHLADTVLTDYILNSLTLALGVGLGTILVGTGLAWIVARYEFGGRRTANWVLLLPLAMPAYILAYTYTGMLDFAGPLQTALRDHFGWAYGDYWFPEVRSLTGAVLMLVLVLYPYVFMLARNAFAELPASLWEASRSMGHSQARIFWRVALPLARPAILTGAALTMMEALADYGTVQYFGVNTFTTGIFRTWFSLGNAPAAAQLASLLCTVVLLVLVLEKWSRRQTRYYLQGQSRQALARKPLRGGKALAALLLCFGVPLLAFILPMMQLVAWASQAWHPDHLAGYAELVYNSLMLAVGAALLVVLLALLFAYQQRLAPTLANRIQLQVVSLGYAIPGTVIAVGVLIPLSWADKRLNAVTQAWFDWTPGLVLSGTVVALLLAYAVRFLAVALQSVESGLLRITPSIDNAARSLGASPARVLRQIHVPMLKATVLSAALLVFVDVLKELPATLVLRPFNFNTLAVKTYELASDERLTDAALPAISIIVTGLLPVILLTRSIDRAHARKKA